MIGDREPGRIAGSHTDKPGALCGWVRGCVAGEFEVPSGWSEESQGEVVGCPDHLEQRAESHTWCNQREGRFFVCTGAPGSFMLTHCESDVNLFLPSYSGDPQPPTQSSPSPPWLHSRWTCLDLPGTGSHVQSGCPGVMAHVLGPERDGCGLASGNVNFGGQLRSPRNRGYSQRTSRVNGSLRLTLTGFRASHT